jgi:hypothetical protein
MPGRLAALFAGILLWHAPPAHAEAPRLLTPADGAIREVLLTVPPEDFVREEPSAALRRTLSGVARALGAEVRYLVHAYPAHAAAVTAILRTAGAREVRFIPSAFGHYTRWPRDMFLVQRATDAEAWLVPSELPRRLDASVPIEIAQQLHRPLWRLTGAGAGGNLVTAGDWVFAGEDLLLDADGSHEPARRKSLQDELAPHQNWQWVAMERATGEREIWHGRQQPLFHLDFFVTALQPSHAGKPAVLVASPRLARRLLGQPQPWADRDSEYDRIAAGLKARGFPVTRLPLLLERAGEDMAIVSHNNVLLAEDGPRRTAYLPRYGRELAPLDDYAAAIYRGHGYSVIWVDGSWYELAKELGSLRCLVQETRRVSSFEKWNSQPVVDRRETPTLSLKEAGR